jgi:glucokinase
VTEPVGSSAGRRIGIDLGGTKCLGVVIDVHGHVVAESRRPTPAGSSAVIDTIATVINDLAPHDSVGVGVAGLVTRDGVLNAAPNLVGIAELPVADRLAERLGHLVVVENDATCATVAEWRVGAGEQSPDMLLVALGTGIGGGVVAGGRLQTGRQGFAGEFGHMVIDPGGPPCVCGRRGCWERYASGAGLARLAREAALGGRANRVVEMAGGDPESVRGEHVQSAAREGDADAVAVIDEFGRWVALGLVNLTNAFDPEVIVLGGGMADGADLYLGPIRRWFAELLYAPELRPHPRLEVARLGVYAGAIGAAMLGGQ